MRVQIIKSMAGPRVSYRAGQVVDVPDAAGRRMIASGAAMQEIETRAYGSSPTIAEGGGNADQLDTKPDSAPKRRTRKPGRTKDAGPGT